jgi:hypothetical protein
MKNETNFNLENLDVLTKQELLIIKGGTDDTIDIDEKKTV